MQGTEIFHVFVEFTGEGITEILGIKRFTAYVTTDQIHRDHVVPLAFKDVLEFHRILRADPPAIAAPGTPGHVVHKFSLFPDVSITERRRRTVLYAGKTPVTSMIYFKERHDLTMPPFCP